jgi:hypothetical protein
MPIENTSEIAALITHDFMRMRLLKAVSELSLPDAWIGAGFVRNLVWDALHGYSAPTPLEDVDVIYFDPLQTDRSVELELETRLLNQDPNVNWQVRNQARMHVKNRDIPYTSSSHAISHWPETATAIAARLRTDSGVELLAPLGIEDLLNLRVRPTPHFEVSGKRALYQTRVQQKNWQKSWPKLKIEL